MRALQKYTVSEAPMPIQASALLPFGHRLNFPTPTNSLGEYISTMAMCTSNRSSMALEFVVLQSFNRSRMYILVHS